MRAAAHSEIRDEPRHTLGHDVPGAGGGAAGAGGGDADVECGLCLDAPEDPVITPCGHTFCRSCIKDSLQQERRWVG